MKKPAQNRRKTTHWEKNKHLFQKLIDNPDFQNMVLAYRKKWGIPATGYVKSGPQWEDKIGRLDDKYYKEQWAEDRKLLKETEKKALNREIGWLEFEDLKTKIHYSRPINAAYHDIDLIIEKMKVSPTWRNNIKQYILLNKPEAMAMPVGISFTVPMKDFEDTITITIDAHTTLEDMIERWSDIELAQKRLKHNDYDKYQPYPNYEKHKQLHELKSRGMKLNEISEKTGVPYNYINIYIKRYLEHINRK